MSIVSEARKVDSQKAAELLIETTKSTEGVLHSPKSSAQIKGFNLNLVEFQLFFWIREKDHEANLSVVRTRAMNICINSSKLYRRL